MCVTGPMASNAADLIISYRLMSQPDPSCSIQSKFALSIPPSPSAKRTIGIYRDWWKVADPRVADLCNKAVAWFQKEKGYEVVDISLPYLAECQLAHGPTCLSGMAQGARRRTEKPENYLSLVGYVNKMLLEVGSQASALDFTAYNSLRTLLMQHCAYLWQKYPGMLILSPTSPMVGWARNPAHDSYGMTDGNTSIKNMTYVFVANMTGTPAASVPVGYVDPEQGEGKLPIGLMAQGEWGSEEQLLAWTLEAEDYLNNVYEDGRRRAATWLDVLKEAQGTKSA